MALFGNDSLVSEGAFDAYSITSRLEHRVNRYHNFLYTKNRKGLFGVYSRSMHSQSSGSQTQTITRPPEASPMNQSGEAVRVVVDRFERVRAQVARTEVSQAERDVGSSVRRSVLES